MMVKKFKNLANLCVVEIHGETLINILGIFRVHLLVEISEVLADVNNRLGQV